MNYLYAKKVQYFYTYCFSIQIVINHQVDVCELVKQNNLLLHQMQLILLQNMV